MLGLRGGIATHVNSQPTLLTTARCVTTGWLSTCSTHWRTFRITPLAGFGITITNDRIWVLEESLLNRNWPWRPNHYPFWGITGDYPLFEYPPAIRKVIYTTNAIESLNSVIRKATKRRKLFPSDDSALKVAFLAIQQASKKWTMPIRDWRPALNRFIIEFGDRLNGHL